MREILFRGKRVDNREWVYGDYVIPNNILVDGIYTYKVIPETVGQFTGLMDKNGTKIFEGDIVNCKLSHNGGFLPHQGEIIYLDQYGGFATRNLGGETLLHNCLIGSFEITGNIHDNHTT